ncbi:hypothetical protein NDU88_002494 [Pleurodeles waltl]|uniref:Uncharacterized protein n=1 Tax=Pleurodeles waltl TaxID=8319 RepID=A0AAV7W2J7_PLEWA|nr:hypothetical protein NDU88_002494 [Pleurodeles waltl]
MAMFVTANDKEYDLEQEEVRVGRGAEALSRQAGWDCVRRHCRWGITRKLQSHERGGWEAECTITYLHHLPVRATAKEKQLRSRGFSG